MIFYIENLKESMKNSIQINNLSLERSPDKGLIGKNWLQLSIQWPETIEIKTKSTIYNRIKSEKYKFNKLFHHKTLLRGVKENLNREILSYI